MPKVNIGQLEMLVNQGLLNREERELAEAKIALARHPDYFQQVVDSYPRRA